MKICASLSSSADIRSGDLSKADIIEIRTDVFDAVPADVLRKGQTGILTFKNDITHKAPDGWITDIGTADRSGMNGTVISSYHDHNSTPSSDEILSISNKMNGDIIKGAFAVNEIKDNVTLLNASSRIGKEHIIIGMNDLGTVTRIRQKRMKNEFTFAYVGEPTAPGQLSVNDMFRLGDDCIVTGIIGYGIGYTRSPAMHNAAFSDSGMNGIYLRFDTPSLDGFEEFMTGFDIKGMNVTMPYKTDIVDHLNTLDDVSEITGAVNTVVNDNGELKGYNTDVHGIDMALKMNSVNVNGKRALIMGSGGAARSCAYILSEKGCDVTVTGRNDNAVNDIASKFSVTARKRTSVAVKGYDIIINCIPLNMNNSVSEYPVNIEQIDPQQIVFDMVYGETHLTDIAKKRKCMIVRGEDMLAYQGMRSFELFTSKNVEFKVMRDAV
ncbi:MAG: shikimate dehydrogenase [Methanomassiliicoccaceae archaeon]|nr:shikimate dehydrogenase [Methanomassiliicoccaceae archaeon]